MSLAAMLACYPPQKPCSLHAKQSSFSQVLLRTVEAPTVSSVNVCQMQESWGCSPAAVLSSTQEMVMEKLCLPFRVLFRLLFPSSVTSRSCFLRAPELLPVHRDAPHPQPWNSLVSVRRLCVHEGHLSTASVGTVALHTGQEDHCARRT